HGTSAAGTPRPAGRSPESAWQPVARAEAAEVAPGGSLLFKRGGSWTGSITIPWSGVIVSAYGSGPPPLITNESTGGSIVDIQGSNNRLAAPELRATRAAPRHPSGHTLPTRPQPTPPSSPHTTR